MKMQSTAKTIHSSIATARAVDGDAGGRSRLVRLLLVAVLALAAFAAAPTAAHACIECEGASFTIEKLQKIDGSGGPFTTATLTTNVGQTVDYEIIVKNNGKRPLTLSNFKDVNCEGIAGGPHSALAPGESTIYTCRHTLSAVGTYRNKATVTAIGSECKYESYALTHTSNTVAVEATPEPSPPSPPQVQPQPQPQALPASPAAETAVAPSQTAHGGVLPSTASAPALHGPEGCVRKSFRASVNAHGVRSVTFWLDKHRLRTLTKKNAHLGRLSLRIKVGHLAVGVHRLVARIALQTTAASAKPVLASRALTFVRCASAAVSPKFTG